MLFVIILVHVHTDVTIISHMTTPTILFIVLQALLAHNRHFPTPPLPWHFSGRKILAAFLLLCLTNMYK